MDEAERAALVDEVTRRVGSALFLWICGAVLIAVGLRIVVMDLAADGLGLMAYAAGAGALGAVLLVAGSLFFGGRLPLRRRPAA